MGDIMRPVPFSEMINRIFSELRSQDSIFGVDRKQFFEDQEKDRIQVFGQTCTTPCGPAAGPHTQLAQNIITSYLAGGRFIELKTVQVMDDLVISKPCIDARDEGYNVEWSTEYTLPKAFDEYLKAWIIIHLLQALQRGGKIGPDGFVFNMSVGYNLEGIRSGKMQTFIDCMIDAGRSPKFRQYLDELRTLLTDDDLFNDTPYEGLSGKLGGLADSIQPGICSQVTISTMHGCPPQEIEAICNYMLTEKKLNTFVKLNPTLLGYDAVKQILEDTGFDYVGLKHESFDNDLRYPDAVAMLHRLVETAGHLGLGFGVKLTNTLGSVNDQGRLPGAEMYMSGRALFPVSTRVAALLSREFDGKLPISFSGGANAFNIVDLFDTGIRPVTMATEMLKPGGYSRMTAMIQLLQKESRAWKADCIDVEKIEHLADVAVSQDYQKKAFRGTDSAKVASELGLYDCYIAPCVEACPIHQNIPDYISLVGEGRYADALELIYQDNALPNITCSICDHQCQYHCSRMDYEGAVRIRDMKKIAVQKGGREFYGKFEDIDQPAEVRAAVVGAGPGGLAAAYFLARAGFQVTVLEKQENAGGVVRNIIPEFRISTEAIEADVAYIKRHGVDFRFGVGMDDVKVDALKASGYDYIFYAVGAEAENALKIDSPNVTGALEFLREYRKDPKSVKLGANVVVCGGGNTAMDSARAAMRVPGVEQVTVVYRRTEKEMPADREEYELAAAEGNSVVILENPVTRSTSFGSDYAKIAFCFLSNPEALADGKLTCRVMKLGEPDASGRRRPVETDETFELDCDNLIAAIGEKADGEAVSAFGLALDEKGWPEVNPETLETGLENVYAIGDLQSGPSTVVRCIASARKAVEAAIDDVLSSYEEDGEEEECECGCGHHHHHGHDEHCHCHEEGGHCSDDADSDDDGCCCDDECGCDDDCCCDDGDDEEMTDEERQDLLDAEEAFFSDIRAKKAGFCCSTAFDDGEFEINEAHRCIDCPYICNKCVEVCPNRANVPVDVRGCELFEDPFQIVHLDAFCNECGNCATFCNHQGKPYKDKFTIFSRKDDFENSTNDGFYHEMDRIVLRLEGKIRECEIDDEGNVLGDADDQTKALIEIIFEDYNYLLGSVEE